MSEAQDPEAYPDEVIEHALAPYADKVPRTALEEMRLAMRDERISHPTSRDLAKRLRVRTAQMRSDDVAVPGVEPGATPKTGKTPRYWPFTARMRLQGDT